MGIKRPFGPAIAERRLISLDTEGQRLRASVGSPRWNGQEWECPFRIRSARSSKTDYAYGSDSMQALANALEGIRVTLETSGRFGWDGGLPNESGLGRQVPIGFGPAFAKRVDRFIDRECELYVERLKARGRRKRRGVVKEKA